MNKILLLFIPILLFVQCKKTEDFTESQDAVGFGNVDSVNIISHTFSSSIALYLEEEDSFCLDIDQDEITDITFYVLEHSLGHGSTHYSSIGLNNDYEIAVEEVYNYSANDRYIYKVYSLTDSTLINIPQILKESDTLSSNLTYMKGIFNLSYNHYGTWEDFMSEKFVNGWNNIGENYIGLRKQNNNIYCWLKLEVKDYSTIILKSFYYTMEKDSLIIND